MTCEETVVEMGNGAHLDTDGVQRTRWQGLPSSFQPRWSGSILLKNYPEQLHKLPHSPIQF